MVLSQNQQIHTGALPSPVVKQLSLTDRQSGHTIVVVPSTASAVTIVVEKSHDGKTWTEIHNAATTAAQDTAEEIDLSSNTLFAALRVTLSGGDCDAKLCYNGR